MTSSSEKIPAAQNGERRARHRRTLLRDAKILYRNRSCFMDCVIVNISESGAKLRPADMPLCPDEFSLQLHGGYFLDCEVVWRRQSVLGVRFVSSWRTQ